MCAGRIFPKSTQKHGTLTLTLTLTLVFPGRCLDFEILAVCAGRCLCVRVDVWTEILAVCAGRCLCVRVDVWTLKFWPCVRVDVYVCGSMSGL
jgi:hypothetical protein